MITYPLNNILYSAEDAELFHCTRTSGVFSADDEFAASVTGADNTVTIGPGIAWIRNARFSGKVAANKTSVSLDMGLADGSFPRIDAVVIQFDANANQTAIVVKQGVAASNPTPPEVVQTEAIYELHLYHVRRVAGAAVVTYSDITDLRTNKAYCGVMMDDVTNIDENKFLSKSIYDPSGDVEKQGGIAAYAQKVAKESSVIPIEVHGVTTSDYVIANLGSGGRVKPSEMWVTARASINIKTPVNDLEMVILGIPDKDIVYEGVVLSVSQSSFKQSGETEASFRPVSTNATIGNTVYGFGIIVHLFFQQDFGVGTWDITVNAIINYADG